MSKEKPPNLPNAALTWANTQNKRQFGTIELLVYFSEKRWAGTREEKVIVELVYTIK